MASVLIGNYQSMVEKSIGKADKKDLVGSTCLPAGRNANPQISTMR
jgi:hypothetical protein